MSAPLPLTLPPPALHPIAGPFPHHPHPTTVDAVPIPPGWRLLLPNSCHVFPSNLFTVDNLPSDMSPTHRLRCIAFVDNPVSLRITASDDPDVIGSETATLCPICGLIVKDNWVATRNGRLRRQLRIESLREHLGMRHHLMHRVQCPAQCNTVCASRGYTKPHRLLHHWSDNIACLVWVADRVEDDENLANLVQWSLGAAWKRVAARNGLSAQTRTNTYVNLLSLLIDRAAHLRKVTKGRMRELKTRASAAMVHRGVLPLQRRVSCSSAEPIHHGNEFISSSSSSHSSSSTSPPLTHLPSPHTEPFSLTRPLDLSASQAGMFGNNQPLVPSGLNLLSPSSSVMSSSTLAPSTSSTEPVSSTAIHNNPIYASTFHSYPHHHNIPLPLPSHGPPQGGLIGPYSPPPQPPPSITNTTDPSFPLHNQSFANLPHPHPFFNHLDSSAPPTVLQHVPNSSGDVSPVDQDVSPLMAQSRPWSVVASSYPDTWQPSSNAAGHSGVLRIPTVAMRSSNAWTPSPYTTSSPVAASVSSDPFGHLRPRQPLHGASWNTSTTGTASPANGSLESLLALEDLGFRWGQTVRE